MNFAPFEFPRQARESGRDGRAGWMMKLPARDSPTAVNAVRTMGDKSPKSTNKQAAQKQAKANANKQTKTNATAAKQAVKGKK